MSLVEPEDRPYEEAPTPAPRGRMRNSAVCVDGGCGHLRDRVVVLAVRPAHPLGGHGTEAAANGEAAQAELNNRIHATSSEFKQALTTEVGMTKQEIAQRAAELERAQKASAAKLSAAQSQQGQQLAAVNTEVSGVKSEVGAAKTDIQKTQTDLAATNAKLEHAMGDLGVQSGLIAHNASELDMLKRKGERNYYDFTLQKNARTPVSTISLQLKKVDPKKSKFTMNVIADDRTIEKKDRTLLEPLQFYTGRDKMLYEVVVFSASKNSISGYLSTPKTAPSPVTP